MGRAFRYSHRRIFLAAVVVYLAAFVLSWVAVGLLVAFHLLGVIS